MRWDYLRELYTQSVLRIAHVSHFYILLVAELSLEEIAISSAIILTYFLPQYSILIFTFWGFLSRCAGKSVQWV